MAVAVITGSAGLVGSACSRRFASMGLDVVGVDNDMRADFFGPEASTRRTADELQGEIESYIHLTLDIRDRDAIDRVFDRYGSAISYVVHCAAQPSHDWAARQPHTDFSVNAVGTLNLLEATRVSAPDAGFVFISTNKVYGDAPNELPFVELETRFEPEPTHHWAEHGIDETMSVDQSLHSLFGASKLAADVLVQEYGRYFGMRTTCLRGGCLTGAGHAGVALHGFLSYLMKCAVTGRRYEIYGYKGKQVRDNLDARDLADAIWLAANRSTGGRVYNIGGGRYSNCSVLEAIARCEEIAGQRIRYDHLDAARVGDHKWWISDIRSFQNDHDGWRPRQGIRDILESIYESEARSGATQG